LSWRRPGSTLRPKTRHHQRRSLVPLVPRSTRSQPQADDSQANPRRNSARTSKWRSCYTPWFYQTNLEARSSKQTTQSCHWRTEDLRTPTLARQSCQHRCIRSSQLSPRTICLCEALEWQRGRHRQPTPSHSRVFSSAAQVSLSIAQEAYLPFRQLRLSSPGSLSTNNLIRC
jgi:hypothetical protein